MLRMISIHIAELNWSTIENWLLLNTCSIYPTTWGVPYIKCHLMEESYSLLASDPLLTKCFSEKKRNSRKRAYQDNHDITDVPNQLPVPPSQVSLVRLDHLRTGDACMIAQRRLVVTPLSFSIRGTHCVNFSLFVEEEQVSGALCTECFSGRQRQQGMYNCLGSKKIHLLSEC